MSNKTHDHDLNRIRRYDDLSDTDTPLDDLPQGERIRKQPRDTRTPTDTKQQRRQRDKAWGRTINRTLRKRRRDDTNKP
jgi:hypothetical protein